MDNCQQPRALNIAIHGMQFAAQAWGNPEHRPVLALHGWLDNSASFFALAPQLDDIYLVAIDMAGHGQSSYRPGMAAYNIWEDIAEIFAIADVLGWDRFGLLGHSRGAIIAALAAGTFPERITHLGLIEGLLPEPANSAETPNQLAMSIQSLYSASSKPRSIYPTLELAIKARERGLFPLSYSAAKALTERGLIAVQEGYHWSTDQRLLVPSAIKLLPEQFSAFIHRITAPVKLVVAQEGLPKRYPNFLNAVQHYPNVEMVLLPGGHHLHMEQEVDAVAAVLNPFFSSEP